MRNGNPCSVHGQIPPSLYDLQVAMAPERTTLTLHNGRDDCIGADARTLTQTQAQT
jgi:hypothetical protein